MLLKCLQKTEEVKEWEAKMIEIGRNGHPQISSTYVYASRR